ncbi:MAG: hypothetical protein ACKVOL_13650 [Novosphingobium sp.]
MMVSAHRFRSIGWIALLLVCGALVMVLAFRVNALRSQVHRTEQQIVALRKEKLYLETEVETRANQQQLKLWNDVEFGYVAPTASQYLSSERQLASFAKPDQPDAPTPIRVASADDAVAAEAVFPSIVSRLAGDPDLSAARDHPAAAPETDESPSAADQAAAAAGLGARLATLGPVRKAPGKPGAASTAAKDEPGLATAGLAKTARPRGHDDADTDRPGKGSKLAAASKSAKAAALGTAKTTKPGSKPGNGSGKASKTAP